MGCRPRGARHAGRRGRCAAIEIGHVVLYTSLALVLLTGVGNWTCRRLFTWAGLGDATTQAAGGAHPPAGWVIGWLERLILAIGIVTHSWEVLAAVISPKTVARFRDMDDRRFAEYFLVGSMFSILWAVLVTSLWLVYDRTFGLDLQTSIARMIAP